MLYGLLLISLCCVADKILDVLYEKNTAYRKWFDELSKGEFIDE